MRKLLDEKYIFCKMSNIKLKESNKLFSKAEDGSSGSCERTSGNSRDSCISGVQKRRECEEKRKGSIDTNKSVKYPNQFESKSKSKNKIQNMQQETDRTCACNFPEYPYLFCQHYYSSCHVHRQQMFSSRILNNGLNVSNCFVPNTFCRSLSETAVPCQQLSNMCFNSYKDRNGAPKIEINQSLSVNMSINGLRGWQFTTLGKTLRKLNGGKNPGIMFKVMTYNVLAQDLLVDHPYLYRDNDKQTLGWEIRWNNIHQSIKEHNCEIICLQEVQQDHINKYFKSLEALGYKGIYKQRTGYRTDGCAVYYKSNLFNLVEYTTVEYRQPNVTILDRDNVGIVATFAPKDNPNAEFIVATTHLLYNPRRHDVRLAQVQVLLAEIDRMAYRHNQSESNYVPVILTGDLNAEPQSPIYNFIIRSILKYENIALRSNYIAGKALIPPKLMITDNCQHAGLLKFRLSNQTLGRTEEQKYIQIASVGKKYDFKNNTDYLQYKFSSGTLTHNFVFKSVYKHKNDSDTEGTTYQNAWVTVDYIFYSGILDARKNFKDGKLKLMSRFTLPTSKQLSNVRIPNINEGSDHLALLAYFKLEY